MPECRSALEAVTVHSCTARQSDAEGFLNRQTAARSTAYCVGANVPKSARTPGPAEDFVLDTLPRLTAACAALVLSLSACGASDRGNVTEQTPSATSSSPTPETLDVAGSVSYLSTVGFTGGSGRGLSFKAPRNGAPCPPEQGYDDVTPGAAVRITSGTDETLATVALGAAGAAAVTRHSVAERDARADLIDAIYGLRIAKTWNAVEQAQLYEAQAKQQLSDVRHPNEWGFEGAEFVAVWCRLPFTAAGLPALDTYVVRVVNRPPTVVSRDDLDSGQETLDLYLD